MGGGEHIVDRIKEGLYRINKNKIEFISGEAYILDKGSVGILSIGGVYINLGFNMVYQNYIWYRIDEIFYEVRHYNNRAQTECISILEADESINRLDSLITKLFSSNIEQNRLVLMRGTGIISRVWDIQSKSRYDKWMLKLGLLGQNIMWE